MFFVRLLVVTLKASFSLVIFTPLRSLLKEIHTVLIYSPNLEVKVNAQITSPYLSSMHQVSVSAKSEKQKWEFERVRNAVETPSSPKLSRVFL